MLPASRQRLLFESLQACCDTGPPHPAYRLSHSAEPHQRWSSVGVRDEPICGLTVLTPTVQGLLDTRLLVEWPVNSAAVLECQYAMQSVPGAGPSAIEYHSFGWPGSMWRLCVGLGVVRPSTTFRSRSPRYRCAAHCLRGRSVCSFLLILPRRGLHIVHHPPSAHRPGQSLHRATQVNPVCSCSALPSRQSLISPHTHTSKHMSWSHSVSVTLSRWQFATIEFVQAKGQPFFVVVSPPTRYTLFHAQIGHTSSLIATDAHFACHGHSAAVCLRCLAAAIARRACHAISLVTLGPRTMLLLSSCRWTLCTQRGPRTAFLD